MHFQYSLILSLLLEGTVVVGTSHRLPCILVFVNNVTTHRLGQEKPSVSSHNFVIVLPVEVQGRHQGLNIKRLNVYKNYVRNKKINIFLQICLPFT